jgi:hypothetical protein
MSLKRKGVWINSKVDDEVGVEEECGLNWANSVSREKSWDNVGKEKFMELFKR